MKKCNSLFLCLFSLFLLNHIYAQTGTIFFTGAGGDDNWENCVSIEVLKCKKPKPSAWKPAEAATLVTAHFKETAGQEVMGYLKKRVFPSEVMNKLLFDMQDSQISSSDMASVFMSEYQDLWALWVSKSVAKKIQAKIN